VLGAWLGKALLGWPSFGPTINGIRDAAQFVSTMAYLSIAGILLGYVAGCSAAGVFFFIGHFKRRGDTSLGPAATDDQEYPDASSFDRLWQRVRNAIGILSPWQPDRPWREAINVFVLVAVLLGLALPYVISGWQLQVAAAFATIALAMGFWWSGTRLAGWTVATPLVCVSALGGLGPAAFIRQLYVAGQRLGNWVPPSVFWIITILAGVGIGLTAAALCGWLRWLVTSRHNARRSGWTRVALGLLTASAVAALYAALILWAHHHSQLPQQRAFALVEQRRGGVWSAGGRRWLGASGIWLNNSRVTDADLEQLRVFSSITSLEISGTRITDRGLVHLESFPFLRDLFVADTRVSDVGLAHLSGLRRLTHLSLERTRVKGPGLSHLAQLPSLRWLSLCGTRLTDEDIAQLSGMASLTALRLADTDVTDRGLERMKDLPQLGNLELRNCAVTDEGLLVLKRFPLLNLDLQGTRISDAGLTHFQGMSLLRELSLQDTQVSDAGLIRLSRLPSLQKLNLRGTRVTEEGIADLAQRMPSCIIESDFWE
jgi:hypothetical protein